MRLVVRRLGLFALSLAIVFSAIGVATESASAAFANGDEVVVFDGALNLRAAPSMNGLILQVLPDGAPLTVTGSLQNVEGIDWYPVVTATAAAGWVSGEFIMLASPGSGDFSVGDDVVVFDGPLNMRNAAGTGATIVDTLPTGATGSITAGPTAANGYDWYQLDLGGWVAGDFLALATSGPPPSSGDFAIGDDIYVFDGPVNFRSAAGLSGTIQDILPQDTTGEVVGGPTTADGYDWYQIQIGGGQTGWVAGDFLALATPDPGGDFAIGDDIYVFDGPLNLRSAAGLSGAILEILPQDATGEIVGGPTTADGYDWYQVDTTLGATGWVAGDFLALDNNGPVVPPGSFPVDSFVFVNVPKLNLRSIASTDGAVLQTMTDGGIATVKSGPVTADGFTWYELFVGEGQNTLTGWAAGEYLTGGIEVGSLAVVADGPLNLRDEATTSSPSLGALQTGDLVDVTSGPIIAGDFIWFGVEVDGTNGFVAGRFLGPVVP
jgi:uncharacterized protein YgiM (DUF1202 family)